MAIGSASNLMCGGMKKTSIATLIALFTLGACDDGQKGSQSSASQSPEKVYENPNERTVGQLQDMLGFNGSKGDP